MKLGVKAYSRGRGIVDEVAREKDLELVINGKTVAVIKLSPGYEREFAVGYCLGEGFIGSLCELKHIEVEENRVTLSVDELPERGERYISSECLSGWRSGANSAGRVESDFRVKAGEILWAMKELQRRSEVWRATGGVHSSALVFEGSFTVVEDVSRHASIDKLLGIGLYKGIDFSRSYILTSGRIPGDMVAKVARAGVPIAATRTAVLNSGVEEAGKTGVTLIGFVRGKRMNIYTHRERIIEE